MDAKTQGYERLISLIPKMNRVMGEDHINTISVKLNLALAYITSGQAKEAINLLLPMKPIMGQKTGC